MMAGFSCYEGVDLKPYEKALHPKTVVLLANNAVLHTLPLAPAQANE